MVGGRRGDGGEVFWTRSRSGKNVADTNAEKGGHSCVHPSRRKYRRFLWSIRLLPISPAVFWLTLIAS